MRIIKRYANRKLYDTTNRRYVKLEDIADYIKNDENIRIIDHTSGADLTALTLAQIIFSQKESTYRILPKPILEQVVKAREETFGTIRDNLRAFTQPKEYIDNEIEHRLKTLVREDQLTQVEYDRIRELLLADRTWYIASESIENSEDRQVFLSLADQIASLEKEIRELVKK